MLIAHAPSVYAEPSGEIQIFIENDFLAGTDRYYSNGLKIGFGAQTEGLAGAGAEGAGLGSYLAGSRSKDKQYELGFFLGQNIYTPRDIRTSEAQPNDRPWAGWLYAGWALQHLTLEPRPVLDTLELNVGVIGPPALAKQVQTQWHKLIGAPEPRGWAHQLPTEPGFMLGYLKKVKFGNESVDIIPTPARPWAPS